MDSYLVEGVYHRLRREREAYLRQLFKTTFKGDSEVFEWFLAYLRDLDFLD